MTRNTLNFLIDVALALCALAMVATGLLIRFVLPPGSGSRRLLWGLGRHEWGGAHFWLAVAIGIILILHLALHWQWVCVTVARLWRGAAPVPNALRRNVIGIASLVVISAAFAAFLWVANESVTDARGADLPAGAVAGHGSDPAHPLQGFMTLTEAADSLGLSVETVRQRLHVPTDLSDDERLGRLSRQLGFTMQQAREMLQTPAASR